MSIISSSSSAASSPGPPPQRINLSLIDLVGELLYSAAMEKKPSHKLPGYIVGARPPQTLSPKAKRQLARLKPSKKAHELAEIAAKAMLNSSISVASVVPQSLERISKKRDGK